MTFPNASRTLTAPFEIDVLFGGIGVGKNVQARWSAPAAVQTAVVLTLDTPDLEKVIVQLGYAPALEKTNVAFPPDVVVDARRITFPPPDDAHVPGSGVAVMV